MAEKNLQTMNGGCLCAALRYTATDVETHHHACHCGMCRRWTGGPLFAAKVASLHFEDETTMRRYASSDWAERGFCTVCGSSVFYYLKPADEYFVPVGSFDDGDAFELVLELFTDQKKGRYDFAGNLPGLTQQQIFEQAQSGD